MKIRLTALVGMACVGSVYAQSSVTLFGVVDAAISRGTANVASRTALTDSGLNSTRVGVRGTEDLGSGLSASFWLEAGMNSDNGAGQATNTNNTSTGITTTGGLTFNRRSTVSLSGAWGEVRLGRDYTPQYMNLGIFDPFNNCGVGATQILIGALQPAAPYAALAGGATGPLVRASNSIGYFLPSNLGGFYGQAMYYLSEAPSNVATKNDGNGFGARVGYAAGPVDVALAISRTTFAVGDVRSTNLGASYDLKVAKLMADGVRDERSGGASGKGWMVAAVVPVGVSEVRASYSTYKLDTSGSPAASKVAIAYQHNLSKRTALYGTYAHLKNKGGSAQALNGAAASPNSASNGFDLGVRHFF